MTLHVLVPPFKKDTETALNTGGFPRQNLKQVVLSCLLRIDRYGFVRANTYTND